MKMNPFDDQLRRSGDLQAILAGLESDNPLSKLQAICGAINHQVFNQRIKDGLLRLQNDYTMIIGYKISQFAVAALDRFDVSKYGGDDRTIKDLIDAPKWFDLQLTEEDREAIHKKLNNPEMIIKCSRCGNNLEYLEFPSGCQVTCKTVGCIQNSWRGI